MQTNCFVKRLTQNSDNHTESVGPSTADQEQPILSDEAVKGKNSEVKASSSKASAKRKGKAKAKADTKKPRKAAYGSMEQYVWNLEK